VLSCSLVGSALGAGGVSLVNSLLSKPDMRIERSFDGQQKNDFPGRPQDAPQGAPQNGQFPSADQNNNT